MTWRLKKTAQLIRFYTHKRIRQVWTNSSEPDPRSNINNWQCLLPHCGVWALAPLLTAGLESRSHLSRRHYIVCISARRRAYSTQFLFCEVLRFHGHDYTTTVLLDTNLPEYGRNLLSPSPNPEDRAGMFTWNNGKFLTTIWRHILKHCNLQAVFCARFVLSLSLVCTGHDH